MSATTAQPTITHNPDRSTAWTTVYEAQSDTHTHVRYTVAYDEREKPEKRWRCNCPASVPCKHISRAQEFAARRWWRAAWAAATPEDIAQSERAYAECEVEGTLTDDDKFAWGILGDVLAERLQEVA